MSPDPERPPVTASTPNPDGPKPGEIGHCGPTLERVMDARLRGEVLQPARQRNRMFAGSLDAADTYETCADELADILAAADRGGEA